MREEGHVVDRERQRHAQAERGGVRRGEEDVERLAAGGGAQGGLLPPGASVRGGQHAHVHV